MTSSPARGLEDWLAAAVFGGEFYRLADELSAAVWPASFQLKLIGEAMAAGLVAGMAASRVKIGHWIEVERRLSGRAWFRRLPADEQILAVRVAVALEDRSARTAVAAVRCYLKSRAYGRRLAAADECDDDEKE